MGPKIPGNTSFFAAGGDDPARLAEALKESHELLALAEQSAGIGIWDTDLATDTVRATPTFFRIMGLPVSTQPVPNDVVRAVRHPEDAGRVRDGLRQALARGVDSYEVGPLTHLWTKPARARQRQVARARRAKAPSAK